MFLVVPLQLWAQDARFLLLGPHHQPQQITASWQQTDQLADHRESAILIGKWYRWLTDGTATRQLAMGHPLAGGYLVLGIQQSGFDNFRESNHQLGYAKQWGLWRSGIQLIHFRQKLEGISDNSLGFGLSSSYQLKPDWQIHLAIRREPTPENNRIYSQYQQEISLAASHQLSPQLQLQAGIMLLPIHGYYYRGGAFYQPTKWWHVFAGYSSHLQQLGFGFGYQYKQVHTRLSAINHPVLGLSYQLSLWINGPSLF